MALQYTLSKIDTIYCEKALYTKTRNKSNSDILRRHYEPNSVNLS